MTIPIRLEVTSASSSSGEINVQDPRIVVSSASATSAAAKRQQLKTTGPKCWIAFGAIRLLSATQNAAAKAARSKIHIFDEVLKHSFEGGYSPAWQVRDIAIFTLGEAPLRPISWHLP